MRNPVWVIGMGVRNPACLTEEAWNLIGGADMIIGGQQQLCRLVSCGAARLEIGNNLDEVLAHIRRRQDKKIVVLTSGDVGFHSIGAVLIKRLPGEDIRFLPNVSSLQEAFARIHEPWQDAVFCSAHSHSPAEIIGWARRVSRLAILTDPKHTPARIAEILLAAGVADCRAVVAENLGTSSEQVCDTRLVKLPEKNFSPINVLLLFKDISWVPEPTIINRPETAYEHRSGLITKADIRLLSLSRLQITPQSVVWDIGAGSGSISIEAAHLAWRGKVFAIEKDEENLSCIHQNRKRYGVLNMKIIAGEAPNVLTGLPAPQAVFIGGSGGRLAAVFDHIAENAAAGCRVVGNFATLENFNEAMEKMKNLEWQPVFSLVQISQSRSIASLNRLEPLNPIFILEGTCKW